MNAADKARSLAAEVLARLESCKRQLFEEIRRYPTPIAGCDQQFNYLLERRSTVAAEEAHVQSIMVGSAPPKEALASLTELIRTSLSLDEPMRNDLLSRARDESTSPI